MATAIKIPDLGTTTDRLKLVRWLKRVDEPVRRGEPLCEVETDKAVSELESVVDGTLLKIAAPEGTEVEQGWVIAYIGQPGESVPEAEPAPTGAAGRVESAPGPARKPDLAPVPLLVRNLAAKEGVDLASVVGTGPGGRISREDVLAAKQQPPVEGVALSANQRAVADLVWRSSREKVPIHLVCRIDMTAAHRLRDELARNSAMPPSWDVIFLHALSRCLREHPLMMSRREGGKIVTADEVDLSFAAALEKGLYRLVVTRADRKSPAEIQREVQALMFRAARGQLTLADQGAACFSISNLGKYPVQSFTAIIPPGQSAVLAIGAVEERVILRGGQAVGVPVCSVTLSVDHLLINGREAGAFLARLKEVTEGR